MMVAAPTILENRVTNSLVILKESINGQFKTKPYTSSLSASTTMAAGTDMNVVRTGAEQRHRQEFEQYSNMNSCCNIFSITTTKILIEGDD